MKHSSDTAVSVTTVLIYEHLQKHELEHKEKQEKGCLALWETILCYARILCIQVKKDLTS